MRRGEKLATPTTWKHKRARIARLSQDRAADDPELIQERQNLKAQRLEEHIAAVINSAPPLTDEQRDRIAAILRGGGGS